MIFYYILSCLSLLDLSTYLKCFYVILPGIGIYILTVASKKSIKYTLPVTLILGTLVYKYLLQGFKQILINIYKESEKKEAYIYDYPKLDSNINVNYSILITFAVVFIILAFLFAFLHESKLFIIRLIPFILISGLELYFGIYINNYITALWVISLIVSIIICSIRRKLILIIILLGLVLLSMLIMNFIGYKGVMAFDDINTYVRDHVSIERVTNPHADIESGMYGVRDELEHKDESELKSGASAEDNKVKNETSGGSSKKGLSRRVASLVSDSFDWMKYVLMVLIGLTLIYILIGIGRSFYNHRRIRAHLNETDNKLKGIYTFKYMIEYLKLYGLKSKNAHYSDYTEDICEKFGAVDKNDYLEALDIYRDAYYGDKEIDEAHTEKITKICGNIRESASKNVSFIVRVRALYRIKALVMLSLILGLFTGCRKRVISDDSLKTSYGNENVAYMNSSLEKEENISGNSEKEEKDDDTLKGDFINRTHKEKGLKKKSDKDSVLNAEKSDDNKEKSESGVKKISSVATDSKENADNNSKSTSKSEKKDNNKSKDSESDPDSKDSGKTKDKKAYETSEETLPSENPVSVQNNISNNDNQGSAGSNENVEGNGEKTSDESSDTGKDNPFGIVIDKYKKDLNHRLTIYPCQYLNVYYEEKEDYVTVNSASEAHRIIHDAAGENIGSDLGDDKLHITDSWLLNKKIEPELIVKLQSHETILKTAGSEKEKEVLKSTITNRPGWDALNAVKSDNIIFASEELLKTEQGVLLLKYYIAYALHPELFDSVDISQISHELMGDEVVYIIKY